MARRKLVFSTVPVIHSTRAVQAKVYRDFEYGEWIVRLYVNGDVYEPADCFCMDQDDGCHTAMAMVARPN